MICANCGVEIVPAAQGYIHTPSGFSDPGCKDPSPTKTPDKDALVVETATAAIELARLIKDEITDRKEMGARVSALEARVKDLEQGLGGTATAVNDLADALTLLTELVRDITNTKEDQ